VNAAGPWVDRFLDEATAVPARWHPRMVKGSHIVVPKVFDHEFAYIFQCDGVAAGSVQDILGCSAKTAKDLQTEIARLEPWQVIARGQEKTEEFVKFTAEAFYKSYS
jgi:hypothetical protein